MNCKQIKIQSFCPEIVQERVQNKQYVVTVAGNTTIEKFLESAPNEQAATEKALKKIRYKAYATLVKEATKTIDEILHLRRANNR